VKGFLVPPPLCSWQYPIKRYELDATMVNDLVVPFRS